MNRSYILFMLLLTTFVFESACPLKKTDLEKDEKIIEEQDLKKKQTGLKKSKNQDAFLFPKRAGIERFPLSQEHIQSVFDPVFFPNSRNFVFVGRIEAELGLWQINMSGEGELSAEKLIFNVPRFNSKLKSSVMNRKSWMIGTPRFFPDGKRLIFAAKQISASAKFANTLGVYDLSQHKLSTIEIDAVRFAQTPDVSKDGKEVIFVNCDEIRIFKMSDVVKGKVKSRLLKKVEKIYDAELMCPFYRARFSPDGQKIAVEVFGAYLNQELQKQYNLDKSSGNTDHLLETWVMNSDGSNLHPLLNKKGYVPISGRIQAGGSHDPTFMPNSKQVVFTHGHRIALADLDGKNAQYLSKSVTLGEDIVYIEADPAVSADGRFIVAVSRVQNSDKRARRIPPAFAVIDLPKVLAEQRQNTENKKSK